MNIFTTISDAIVAISWAILNMEASQKPSSLAWVEEIDTASLASFLAVIIALFVPVAIFVYQDLDSKKEEGNVFICDKVVVLNQVIKSKFTLLYVIVASLVIIALSCKSVRENLVTNFVLLLIFSICIIGLICTLVRIVKYLNPISIAKKKTQNKLIIGRS